MKLSTWAKKQGIGYNTAWRWVTSGKMPVKWYQTETGTIIVEETVPACVVSPTHTYTYSRVSSAIKKDDLNRQQARCAAFCEANGWSLTRQFKEVASGMNDNRRELNKIFELPPGRLVVENKDRLTRFGFNYIKLLLTKMGWEVVVINQIETDQEDIMKDLISVITSFCCRIYGLRRGQAKSKEIQKCSGL